MRVLVLNSAVAPDPMLDALTTRVAQDFLARKAAVETVTLREVPVAYCQGCFECWTHTPGVCKIDDAGRGLARAFVTADIVIVVTPVRFGSYASACKKLLDRTLGMLLPFFRRIDGEVHHSPRYAHPPAFGVLAVLERPDPDMEQTVRTLVTRNAINFAAPIHAVRVVHRDMTAAECLPTCDALAEAISAAPTDHRVQVDDVDAMLPQLPVADDVAQPPTKALLLVGSSKPTGTSTSEVLGTELLERLAVRGVVGDVRFVHRDAHAAARRQELVQDIRSHDLLIVAAPLYIDALPALVTHTLEAVLDDRSNGNAPPLTVAFVLNSGFPEARHMAVARTIGALFAREAQARWAGALQLGGGGVIAGKALGEVGHLVEHLAPALDATAAALAEGRAIPAAAMVAFQQPLMPTTLYMAAGDAGWLWTAAHEGSLTKLWRRPDASAAARAPSA